MAILQLSRVTMRFGGLIAVNELDLALEAGQLYGLIGPNGAGKTTVFNVITGVYRPAGGDIVFEGRPIAGRRRASTGRAGSCSRSSSSMSSRASGRGTCLTGASAASRSPARWRPPRASCSWTSPRPG